MPNPTPVGFPNFFIDNFRVPSYLLPIYMAAGTQYNVQWQVLAAINEVESDYGRNTSVSSAGAVGTMQFLPGTWKQYAVDADGDGVADPYSPVDAIFTAANYLHAAGGSKDIRKAVFAYNHADWYVKSVMLRAELIGGMPDGLVSSLAGMVMHHFPVAAKAKYADDALERQATRRAKNAGNSAIPPDPKPGAKSTSIFAKPGSPIIAVGDGKITKLGQDPKLGRYVVLQDEAGNTFTYAHLGSIPKLYPFPNPARVTAGNVVKDLSAGGAPAPKAPATAGAQQAPARKSGPISIPVAPQPGGASGSVSTPMVKERLFAYPNRPASYAAGGNLQLKNTTAEITNFQNYFSDVLHLRRDQYTLKPLTAGAKVVAGTIIGRMGPNTPQTAAHMQFMIQPAGKKARYIDPKVVLDGWELLQATGLYRAVGLNPLGPKNPTIGQLMLLSKTQLANRILQDRHVQMYTCGRQDIETGRIDTRVEATIEFLSASGFDPYVSGLQCGRPRTTNPSTSAAVASGTSVEISKINNVPVLHHSGRGSVTDMAIQRLFALQGAMKPQQIISTMRYKGKSNTFAQPDHQDRIQVIFVPYYGENKKLADTVSSMLQPQEWIQLIKRLAQIPQPAVPLTPSKYAIRVAKH